MALARPTSLFEGGQRRAAKAKRRRGMLIGLTQSLPRSRTNIPLRSEGEAAQGDVPTMGAESLTRTDGLD